MLPFLKNLGLHFFSIYIQEFLSVSMGFFETSNHQGKLLLFVTQTRKRKMDVVDGQHEKKMKVEICEELTSCLQAHGRRQWPRVQEATRSRGRGAAASQAPRARGGMFGSL
jgi:hypothetical protein